MPKYGDNSYRARMERLYRAGLSGARYAYGIAKRSYQSYKPVYKAVGSAVVNRLNRKYSIKYGRPKRRRVMRRRTHQVYGLHGRSNFWRVGKRGSISRAQRAALKLVGKNIVVYNGYGNTYTTTTGQQAIGQDSFMDSNVLSQAFIKYSSDMTQNVYIMGGWQKWEFTNSSNTPVFMDLYLVKPRHSIQGSATSTGFNDPMAAWNSGLAQEGDTAPLSNLQPRASPLTSRAFVDNYKICVKRTVKLNAGQVHCVTLKVRSPFRINGEEIRSLNNGASMGNLLYPASIKGRTYYLMWAVSGSPVKVVAPDADAGKYTTSACEVGHIFTSQYVIKAVNPNNTTISDSNALSNTTADHTEYLNMFTGQGQVTEDL